MIIAVDFDDTLFEFHKTNPKEVGSPMHANIALCIKLRELGHKLILWTCREGEALSKAETACAFYGLYFDAINENLHNPPWPNSRKVYADLYFDDKAVNAVHLEALNAFVKL